MLEKHSFCYIFKQISIVHNQIAQTLYPGKRISKIYFILKGDHIVTIKDKYSKMCFVFKENFDLMRGNVTFNSI